MQPPEKPTTTTARKPRDDFEPTPNILIKRDFYNLARNRRWINEQGADAVIILQVVWIESSGDRRLKLHKDEVKYLPFPFPYTETEIHDVLESAVAVGLLERDGDYYYNSTNSEHSEAFQAKRRNYREGWEKRNGKHKESSMDSSKNHDEQSINLIQHSILNTQTSKDLRSKEWCDFTVSEIRELVEKFPPFPLDETGASLIRWVQFQDNKFNKQTTFQQLEALLMSYSGREKELSRDINASIAAGYRKVYPEAKANSPNSNGFHKKTNFERNMEILKASNERYGNKQITSSTSSNLPKLPVK